jgi:hypothetical protein
MGRPAGRLLAGVPMELVLAQTETVAVALSRVAACEVGFEVELATIVADGADDFEPPWGPPMRGRRREPPEQAMRFGVRYPDGSKAELDAPWRPPGERLAHGPVIHQGGGSGGDGEWRQELWFWPLPAPGTIAFALEWKAQGIELQLHELDTAPLHDAAARSQTLFEFGDLAESPGYTLGTIHLHESDGEPD